jgi:hypothetical protein
MSSYLSYDNTCMPYDPTAIVTNSTFDIEESCAYSPLYMPATLYVAYGVFFAAFTSIFIHTFNTRNIFTRAILITDDLFLQSGPAKKLLVLRAI